jgi:hypothetical protein
MFIVIIISALMLSSCGDIAVKIVCLTSDLLKAVTTGENDLYATSEFSIDDLTDAKDIAYLKSVLKSMSHEHVVNGDYGDSLKFDMNIPIVKYGSQYFNENNVLVYIIAYDSKYKYNYSIRYNEDLVKQIDDYMYENHAQHLDLSKMDITIDISNDTENTIGLNASSVYVNDKAYPFHFSQDLMKRDIVELKVSDVLKSAIAEDNNLFYYLFGIQKGGTT